MKKILGLFLAVSMLFNFVLPLSVYAKTGETYYFSADDFSDNPGSWVVVEPQLNSTFNVLRGLTANGETAPAVASFTVKEDGAFTLWVRSSDTTGGTRNFKAGFDGKLFSTMLGKNGKNGWAWEKAGTVSLEKGTHSLYVSDVTKYYARAEAFAISSEEGFVPPEDPNEIKKGLKDKRAKIVKTPASALDVELTEIKVEEVKAEVKPEEITVAPDDPERTPSAYTLKADKNYFNISPENLENIDTFLVTDTLSQLAGPYFHGGGKKDQEGIMTLTVPKTGIYTVWARTKDVPSNSGSRHFTVSVDGTTLPSLVGVHGKDGWEWEKAGKIELTAGEHNLSVKHTGAYGRLDMLLVTDDNDFTPPWENAILADWLKNNRYDASKVVIDTSSEQQRPDSEIAVRFNGEYMQFDVDPVLINDRTMVPLRAIFEALGATVSWNDETQTATGNRNSRVVSVSIGSNIARINGEQVEIDQSAVLINDRTLVPLRFVSEAYGATVTWDDATQTVSIVADSVPQAILLLPQNFSDLGTWVYEADYIRGNTLGESADVSTLDLKPATASFSIPKDGTYNVWINSKDYATNQPGTRFFHAEVDGVRSDVKFGAHGKEGFSWQKAGTYEFKAGAHKVSMIDTSAFYARCGGVFITDDLDYVPSDDKNEMLKVASGYDPFAEFYPESYPSWAKEAGEVIKSESIENDSYKLSFYQVNGPKGTFVQDEIYAKHNGQWVKIKDRTEETGYMLVSAHKSSYAGNDFDSNFNSHLFTQTILKDGQEMAVNLNTFYKAGVSSYLLASDFQKTEDGKIVLAYDNPYTTATTTYGFDDFVSYPKAELSATFKQDGAYSFLIYSGDGVTEEQFDTVTAPLMFVKHAVPKKDILFAETNMFTPMTTFHYTADNNVKTPGKMLTSGFVIEPEMVGQDFVYPSTSTYGITFRTVDELVRPQIMAPLFGTEGANRKAGETYRFAYRLVNDFNDWEETYMHIAEDMYNFSDLRTNYYTSLNDALYNTIDLLKDDYYGGWDAKGMGNYNMERKNLVSVSNPQAFGQVYLWTDDEEFLETRLIPAIAFSLTRGSYHMTVQGEGDAMYKSGTLGTVNAGFGANVYGGLYEMSQGRIPYLMQYALNESASDDLDSNIARYKYSENDVYKQAVIKQAEAYILDNPNTGEKRDKHFVNVFVYVDYIIMVDTFLNAYEFTGEQKYLDHAKEAAYLLATGTWTTGYQNDYATAEYEIESEKAYGRPLPADGAGFFWHGDHQWRPGNKLGEYTSSREMAKPESETVPGWLPARAGFGTEHARTPGMGSVITMNNWTGALLRLAEYTGEDYFKTMAHNAMIGRFGTYPGYYIDRYITHQMKPEYPYEGPDYTSIYWHHIPVFLGMLQDYIVNSAWERSNGKIDFESTFQSGYAYFSNYCYGHKPGRFYDEDGFYLWVDRGIIDTNGNVNLDYICGRKDGKLAIALMNEAQENLTETVTLGEKIEGGAGYSGKATLYDASGNKTEIDVVNGAFTVSVPVRSIQTVVLDIPSVKKPSWATDYTYSNALGETVSEHDNGKGYILQFNDDAYYAYVYTDEKAENTKSVTFEYTVDGKKENVVVDRWPFETIIKVEDVTKPISYTVTVTTADGEVKKTGGGTLKTLKQTGTAPEITLTNIKQPLKFDPFEMTCTYQGLGGGYFRLIISTDKFPFDVKESILKGLTVKGKLKGVNGNADIPFESTVAGNEMRADGNITLLVLPTENAPLKDYDNDKAQTHKFELTLYPEEQ
ncbi:MAG: hypothetical protein IJE10_08390 [Clostridia bacterium]|nr:hypothetical protein [Clostridia bacterium]